MKAPQDVILAPVITEKSAGVIDEGKYTFKVAVSANKTEIKDAVEKLFGVKVTGVNIANYDGKMKRQRYTVGRTPSFKKAVVTIDIMLSFGSGIDLDFKMRRPSGRNSLSSSVNLSAS